MFYCHVGRELAGSRAGSVIMLETWKIPDIPLFCIFKLNQQEYAVSTNSLKLNTCEKELKTGTSYKKLASIFNHYWVL